MVKNIPTNKKNERNNILTKLGYFIKDTYQSMYLDGITSLVLSRVSAFILSRVMDMDENVKVILSDI